VLGFTSVHPDILLPYPKLQGQKTLIRQQIKRDTGYEFLLFKTSRFSAMVILKSHNKGLWWVRWVSELRAAFPDASNEVKMMKIMDFYASWHCWDPGKYVLCGALLYQWLVEQWHRRNCGEGKSFPLKIKYLSLLQLVHNFI